MLPLTEGDPLAPGGILADEPGRRRIIEEARERVAALLGAEPGEIIFTSGGTESCNAALKGVALAGLARGGVRSDRSRILVAATEHTAVLYPARTLGKLGFEVREIPVDHHGLVDRDVLEEMLDERTLLVSVALANGETGTIQPLEEIGRQVHARGALLHTDACLAAAGMRVDLPELGTDLASVTAHKMAGPMGAGALWIREGIRVQPLIEGGTSESGRRGGAESIVAIAGFGEAASLTGSSVAAEMVRLAEAGEWLEQRVLEVPGVRLNGPRRGRLPGMVNVSVDGVDGEALLTRLALQDIAVSTGSSCFDEAGKPSHVLTAMGAGQKRATSSVLFSLGWTSTIEQMRTVASAFAEAVESLRAIGLTDPR